MTSHTDLPAQSIEASGLSPSEASEPDEDSEIDFDDETDGDQLLLDVVEAEEAGVRLDDPDSGDDDVFS